MSSEENDLLFWLRRGAYKMILELCESAPRTAKDIAKLTRLTDIDAAEELEILEKSGGISYSNEGWKTTELGLRVLKKYFR